MKTITKQLWLCQWRDDNRPYVSEHDPKTHPRAAEITVLSGPHSFDFPVSEHTCPHCHTPIAIEAAAAAKFRITGPGHYKTRNGASAFILSGRLVDQSSWRGYADGADRIWLDSGRYDVRGDNGYDIVVRIS